MGWDSHWHAGTNPKRVPSLSCVKTFKPDFLIAFSAVGVIGFMEDGKMNT